MSKEIIYGKNPVKEAVRGGKRNIYKIELANNINVNFIQELTPLCSDKKIPYYFMDKDELTGKLGKDEHQGAIAYAASYKYTSVDTILKFADVKKEHPLLIILDHVEDPQNLGAIIRTSEAVGVHGIIIPRRRSVGVTPAVTRASSGASEFVKIACVGNIARIISELQQQWIWVIGCEGNAETIYYELDYNMPVAVVLGSEGRGLSNIVKKRSDHLVKIPMYGNINSLNVATTCGIMLYEALKGRLT